jgi:hypothetical protein
MEERLDEILAVMDRLSADKHVAVRNMTDLNSLHGKWIREYDSHVLVLLDLLKKDAPISSVMQNIERFDAERTKASNDLKIARLRYKQLVQEYNEASREKNMLVTRMMMNIGETDRHKFLVMHETRPGGPEYYRLMSDLPGFS